MSIFRKILGLGTVDAPKPNKRGGSADMTNEDLLEQLSAVFRSSLEKESVRKRMMFPMCFNVLMHKEDYNSRKSALVGVLPEVIDEFYSIIREYRNKHPRYVPLARKWHFQFSPCQVDSIKLEDGTDLKIEKGRLAVTARLYTENEVETDTVNVESNCRVSLVCNNSGVMSTADINLKVLVGVDMLSEGVFKYNFDENLGEKPETPSESNVAVHEKKFSKIPGSASDRVVSRQGEDAQGAEMSFAKLMYEKDGKRYSYLMHDTMIQISGISREPKRPSVFYVDSDDVYDPHVAVRYLKSEGKFQVAAFGPVIFNERSMKVSTEESPEWRDMPNKSSIFINGSLTVYFNKLVK